MTKHLVDFPYKKKNLKWCCLGDGYDCINSLILCFLLSIFIGTLYFLPHCFFIFYFFYFILNVMHKSCPAHHQKVTVPDTPFPWKNSSQQFLTFVFPFYWAYIAFSVAFFCMHIYVENLLLITCLNVSGKGRIYYWNIFGLFSLFCLSG